MYRWIAVLLLIPFLDAVLLAVLVSQFEAVGWVAMVLFVVLTGLLGMLFVRAEGRRTLRKMQRSLVAGEPPTNQLLDGGLLIAAGAFLLTPGLVTDILGFLLVVPITRVPIRMGLKRFVIVPYLDRKADGLVSGTVWTAGFPDETMAGQGTADSSGTGGGAGGTYDLGADAYSVDSEGRTTYTVDLGDERTTDRSDDEDDDPSAR
ncbi:FxsA family protein [Natrarchaeobaculum aegyptiacum]|uniref:Membrane protein FxsA n=1 Tax=Natrarchaeobaculum aegyptiacum TaxID=745377 RepID=A0A2Z2HTH2_9EURY|nr:FxsA family protein [Natrarchaeobaculum aegyptiacum]ARS90500.1 membrane protein FxsA [Natrarchaeobaculum aegyptiacum]